MSFKILVLVVVLLTCGCTVKTRIVEPDGSTYTVTSKSDARVVMERGSLKITIDNRGKPNIFESLLGWLLLKTPDITQAD